MKYFHIVMVNVFALFRARFWRYILTGKIKVRVYLSSGEHMDLIVHKWETQKTNGIIDTWSADGILKEFQVNPKAIIAWRVR